MTFSLMFMVEGFPPLASSKSHVREVIMMCHFTPEIFLNALSWESANISDL